MKKIAFISLLFVLVLCGCSKTNKNNVVNNFDKYVTSLDAYKINGILSISNNEDTYNYDVEVSFKEKDNYRVSLINKSNGHEQIILKSNNEVYVITPALNKSFKFQSNWPMNNSQVYILESLLNDIISDENKTVTEVKDGFIIETKVNYPNNIGLVRQKIYLDKDNVIKKVEVLNDSSVVEMTMEFNRIDDNPIFDDNYFKLESIISNIETDDNINETINEVIYPLYIPTGTVLSNEEKVSKDNGERIILTFDGEKPFLLVEETSTVEKDFSIVPIFGDPSFLKDTIGAITDNSLSWSSGGIDYYLVSDVMGKNELIEIANSISTIPIMK